jgi:hypothetical protein
MSVMPGLVPGIHAFLYSQEVDGRDKPGHDAESGSRFVETQTSAAMTPRGFRPLSSVF